MLFFILSGNYKRNVASAIDNRYLAEFPQKLDENFTKEISDYVQNRIGCRDLLISLYTNFNNRVFRIFPNHMYGKNGNLFGNSNNYIASYQHLNGDDEWAEYFSDYIYKLEKYCKQKDVEFVYMLNPDKFTIYPEKMPDSIGGYNTENLTDQIKRKICDKGVRHVFVDDIFLNEKSDQSYFNKKYDVAHWSDYGRIIGANAVLKELSLSPLSVTNDFNMYEVVQKKQIVSAVTINDKLTIYQPELVYKKEETNMDSLQLIFPEAFGVYKNPNATSEKNRN